MQNSDCFSDTYQILLKKVKKISIQVFDITEETVRAIPSCRITSYQSGKLWHY